MRVAGTPLAAAPTGEFIIAEALSGFPQSMQKREPGSFCRPQTAHVVTTRGASAGIGVG
jgi:hypothetical protein